MIQKRGCRSARQKFAFCLSLQVLPLVAVAPCRSSGPGGRGRSLGCPFVEGCPCSAGFQCSALPLFVIDIFLSISKDWQLLPEMPASAAQTTGPDTLAGLPSRVH